MHINANLDSVNSINRTCFNASAIRVIRLSETATAVRVASKGLVGCRSTQRRRKSRKDASRRSRKLYK